MAGALTPSLAQNPKLQRDLNILVRFVELYCADHHASARQHVPLRGCELPSVALCPHCAKLLQHAVVKRTHCPMSPKPSCKHCPRHCYAPAYRQQMQQVMRYSGRKFVLRGRLDYLLHLLF